MSWGITQWSIVLFVGFFLMLALVVFIDALFTSREFRRALPKEILRAVLAMCATILGIWVTLHFFGGR